MELIPIETPSTATALAVHAGRGIPSSATASVSVEAHHVAAAIFAAKRVALRHRKGPQRCELGPAWKEQASYFEELYRDACGLKPALLVAPADGRMTEAFRGETPGEIESAALREDVWKLDADAVADDGWVAVVTASGRRGHVPEAFVEWRGAASPQSPPSPQAEQADLTSGSPSGSPSGRRPSSRVSQSIEQVEAVQRKQQLKQERHLQKQKHEHEQRQKEAAKEAQLLLHTSIASSERIKLIPYVSSLMHDRQRKQREQLEREQAERDRERLQAALKRAVGLWHSIGMSRGWRTWREWFAARREKLQLLRRGAAYLKNRDLAKGWRGWRVTYEERLRLLNLLRRAARKSEYFRIRTPCCTLSD